MPDTIQWTLNFCAGMCVALLFEVVHIQIKVDDIEKRLIPQNKEKEKEMTIEELEKRERDAYEAFMEADWMHADMRLSEWLDAVLELNEAKWL
ncbi:hypothetical protein [Collinsella sp. CM84Y_54]|uniref:hypothetical protein n=1 Tax=Collinsella sp. CM84Y_54 TaxID=3085309 RepID=UPI002E76736B|nr:hypothetical protein [Collinsella sp. CM84Y_54]